MAQPALLSAEAGSFSCEISIPVGKFEYKYLVDDAWAYDPDKQSISNAFGSVNNILVMESSSPMPIMRRAPPAEKSTSIAMEDEDSLDFTTLRQ